MFQPYLRIQHKIFFYRLDVYSTIKQYIGKIIEIEIVENDFFYFDFNYFQVHIFKLDFIVL